MITEKKVEDTICQLYKKAAISLPEDVKISLESALKVENDELPQLNIEAILKNIELAEKRAIPMCQDTGLPIIFVKIGKVEFEDNNIYETIYNGIIKGVQKATKKNTPSTKYSGSYNKRKYW